MCETASERLDGANGLLLAPHIDHLFDIGLITFDASGQLLISESLDQEAIDCLGLARAKTEDVGAFTDKLAAYLTYLSSRERLHRLNEPTVQKLLDTLSQLISVLHFTFPNHQNLPALILEPQLMLGVSVRPMVGAKPCDLSSFRISFSAAFLLHRD